jgi:putative protease
MPLLELICPAGSLPALKAAVDHGADGVYLGLKDNTNARNFSGLNLDAKSLAEGMPGPLGGLTLRLHRLALDHRPA